MAKSITPIVAFNSGEWSPLVVARTDQAKYRTACKQAKNVIIMKQGGAARRPGTRFIAIGRDQTEGLAPNSGQEFTIRLHKFQFSPDTTFMLEWGDHYVRFYSNGAQVLTTVPMEWDSLRSYGVGMYVHYGSNYWMCHAPVSWVGSVFAPPVDPTHWQLASPYPLPGYPPIPAPLELVTPYSARIFGSVTSFADTEVHQLKFCQINDVVYVCHPSYPVYKLTRYADTNWNFVPVSFLIPAMRDLNATDTTIAASATKGSVTLTATAPAWVTATYYQPGDSVSWTGQLYVCTAPHTSSVFLTDQAAGLWTLQTIFDLSHNQSYWLLKYPKQSNFVSLDLTANGDSSTISCLGQYTLVTEGVWIGDVSILRSLDNGTTWVTILTEHANAARNLNVQGNADVRALYKINLANVATPGIPGSSTPMATFQTVESFVTGLVQITGVTGAYTANASVILELDSTSSTAYWAEGAWSGFRGYPRAVTAFDQRMIYGGNDAEPQRIWGSKIGDFENFDYGDQTLADDAFAFDLAASGAGTIQWLNAQNDLFAGFDGEEWVVSSQDGLSAISAANVKARRQSGWGSSAGVSALVVGDACIYCQRNGTSVRQMMFWFGQQKYMSQDLTSLSDHLFTDGVAQMDYQGQVQQQGVLWVVTKGGDLNGMTYELEQEVFGWHHHLTGEGIDFGVESVSTVQGKAGNDDEVWLVVNRLIGGQNVRYIERFDPTRWTTQAYAYHVDCGLQLTNPTSDVISGLTHLIGRSVEANIGGIQYGPVVVDASGNATFSNYSHAPTDIINIGLHNDAAIQPMDLLVDSRAGDTTGLKKNISGVNLNLYRTLGCLVGDGVNQDFEVQFSDASDITAPPVLTTGVVSVNEFTSEYDDAPSIVIKSNGAMPLTLLGLAVKYELSGTP